MHVQALVQALVQDLGLSLQT